MSGSEMAREKEKVAAKMREKQAAGTSTSFLSIFGSLLLPCTQVTLYFHTLHIQLTIFPTADAKKAAEAAAKK